MGAEGMGLAVHRPGCTMGPYPVELRWRVVDAHLNGKGSLTEIAEQFSVSESFVCAMIAQYRQTGSVVPRPHGGGRHKLGWKGDAKLRALVGADPDATLDELCARLQRSRGISLTRSGMGRALRRLGLPRKKKVLHASEQDRPDVQVARAAFRRRARRRDPRRYVFVDEFGINLAMTRTYGRAPRSARVVDKVPTNYGDNYTLVYGLGLRGVLAPLLFPGAMDGAHWNTYVPHCLAPQLHHGDVVVFDGVGAHRTARAREAIAKRGAIVDPLPPYSPDLSPIEPSGSKVKTALRAVGARTRRRLYDAAGPALRAISRRDAAGWFRHCGFPSAPKVNLHLERRTV